MEILCHGEGETSAVLRGIFVLVAQTLLYPFPLITLLSLPFGPKRKSSSSTWPHSSLYLTRKPSHLHLMVLGPLPFLSVHHTLASFHLSLGFQLWRHSLAMIPLPRLDQVPQWMRKVRPLVRVLHSELSIT